ncbi:MAG: hypothetical protein LBV17_10845, partial [Treponema sp.]|nr:hypothetical protein [Treponema sp.]
KPLSTQPLQKTLSAPSHTSLLQGQSFSVASTFTRNNRQSVPPSAGTDRRLKNTLIAFHNATAKAPPTLSSKTT